MRLKFRVYDSRIYVGKIMTYIRVKDVEKIIDRDRNTILRWERAGLIPHPQKDSRGWRFYTQKDIEVIQKFMESVRKELPAFKSKKII